MDHYMGTIAHTRDGFEVMVGQVGWSPETLGTVDGGDRMFEQATELLDLRYGYRPVRGAQWAAVPGSDNNLFVVAVSQ